MLILTRNIGQNIMINDDITISILNVTGQQVKLGVAAPKEVSVHRQEIYDRIQAEKKLGRIIKRITLHKQPLNTAF